MLESVSDTSNAALQSSDVLSPEQIQRIRSLWDTQTIKEIASEVGAQEDIVSAFARTHYLYFKYLR